MWRQIKTFFQPTMTMERDPVCRMRVDPRRPPGGTIARDDITYYFCGPGCRGAFEADPGRYKHRG